MSKLVQIHKNALLTTSVIIANGMKLEHRAVMALIIKYKDRLASRGDITFEMSKPIKGENGGRPVKYAIVNESHFLFLATLMRNSETVLDFKDKLTQEFERQKKLIAHLLTQRHNADWLEKRQQGKLSRREETDTIKEFVVYAKAQGSSKPEWYYVQLSKMENKALFIIEQEFPNLRECLSGQQLSIIATADMAIAKALKYGMEEKMHYKDIFQLAKQRMLDFAEIVGKSLVPYLQKTLISDTIKP